MKTEYAFFIYLLERYAEYHNRPTPDVLQQWDDLGITQRILEMYEQYHSERLQNTFDDIDAMIAEWEK